MFRSNHYSQNHCFKASLNNLESWTFSADRKSPFYYISL